MQAVILAAGMGSRLGKYTKNNTKCMLEINGKTLIERSLESLYQNTIKKCIIVVGYQKQNLIDLIGNSYKNIEIIYVHNDIYDKTNNIYSLYLAKDYLLQDDTLLLESDLIFDQCIITELLKNKEETLAVVDKFESWMDGTVVQISSSNLITNFIPKKFFCYDEKSTYYKTVNIYKFSKEFLTTSYVPFLEAYSQAMGRNEYYEQVLRVITTLEKNELKALPLTGQKWYEIDDVQDKDIAEVMFCEDPLEKVKKIQKRYGGYWRFPQMKDFCYLVNPYFPTPVMINEMKSSFTDLISQYPSGLNTQNLLAGKMFSIEPSNIIVGNGAAELIRSVSHAFQGSLGVIYPTFNEYPESMIGHSIVQFSSSSVNYTIDDLLQWQKQCDNLLLINPDNPSGNIISKKDILILLKEMAISGKKLILDESFIDFSINLVDYSVFHQSILDEFPNLILIKSISKSYGVPGIRLGVLACSDELVISTVRKNVSIWNINSFGEFFLQIIGKYAKDYKEACKKIIHERERFFNELCKIKYLKVLPSQANYFMCHIENRMSAQDLTVSLLAEHSLFIKDLTGKNGIQDNKWIRIAVRNSTDNDFLIEKLKSIKPE